MSAKRGGGTYLEELEQWESLRPRRGTPEEMQQWESLRPRAPKGPKGDQQMNPLSQAELDLETALLDYGRAENMLGAERILHPDNHAEASDRRADASRKVRNLVWTLRRLERETTREKCRLEFEQQRVEGERIEP